MTTWLKTNIPGFSKNKKTNVLINEQANTAQIHAARQKHKQTVRMERRITELENQLFNLNSRLRMLEEGR